MSLKSTRRFQLWEYRVSHGSLLIRSPKGPEEPTNVDLVFAGVEYIGCPRMMRGLGVVDPSPQDTRIAQASAGEFREPDRLFVLLSGGVRHFIVATSCRLDEHDTDIFDSPFD